MILDTFKARFATESSSQGPTNWVEVAVFLVRVDIASFSRSESLAWVQTLLIPNLPSSRNHYCRMGIGEACIPRHRQQGLAVLLVYRSPGQQTNDLLIISSSWPLT